jgi:methylenetetrahydrofolate--tRNA-(uracil-5-)-methyltransferase
MASGMVAGINAAIRYRRTGTSFRLPETTMMGALAHYISDPSIRNFQPMNANFGILPSIEVRPRAAKEEKYALMAQRSLDAIEKCTEHLKLLRT